MTPRQTPAITIRDAHVTDLESIHALFNAYVTTSTIMFQQTPTTCSDRQRWFEARHGYPTLVAVADDIVVGWASAGRTPSRLPPRARSRARSTCTRTATARESDGNSC